MEPNIHLIIHNIFSGLSAVALLGIFFFVLLNKDKTVASVTIGLASLSAAVFIVSHAIGTSVADPTLSRNILMFNLVMFFIGSFNVHSVAATTGKEKKHALFIGFLYLCSLVAIVFFSIRPELFLFNSVPKMYFPNYYEPGVLNFSRVIFLYGICVPYLIYNLTAAFRKSGDQSEKNKLRYFLWFVIAGYGVGLVPNFLVYNIQIDPLWGTAFAVVLAVPFAIGAVKHGLFNFKVVAKSAFWYGTAVAVAGGFIVLSNYISQIIIDSYPEFPSWTITLLLSALVVAVAFIIWRRLREDDLLKYEFVTIVTHKFRTPLTGIKWATEELYKNNELSDEARTQVKYIRDEGSKLTELTGLLTNLSGMENDTYDYHIVRNDLSMFVGEVAAGLANQSKIKNIEMKQLLESEATALFDSQKTKFVLQVLIENALHYTPEDGKIVISTRREGKNIICSVKDSGIGLSKDEMSRMFSKFYRGHKARLADTEGVGIGLYLSKQIILRQKGKIWVESEGENKGSTFSFSLPIAK